LVAINSTSGKNNSADVASKRSQDTDARLDNNDEVNRLRQELERVKEERDILKKAAAYFAKDLK
jgi:transposase-like protein